MRFLADENIPMPVIDELSRRKHDIESVFELHRGASDESILMEAQRQGRILITLDKVFGELVFRSGLAAHAGIVLFRVDLASPEAENEFCVRVLESRTDWAGQFAVISNTEIRFRPLPV